MDAAADPKEDRLRLVHQGNLVGGEGDTEMKRRPGLRQLAGLMTLAAAAATAMFNSGRGKAQMKKPRFALGALVGALTAPVASVGADEPGFTSGSPPRTGERSGLSHR
jgi:hypothetical protein